MEMEAESKDKQEQIPNEKKPIHADGTDRIFSFIYFLVGYALVYTFTSPYFNSKLAVFTVFYAIVVYAYFRLKKIQPAKESYFWLAIMLSIGIPYAFWSVMNILQVISLIFVAAYWTLSLSGRFLSNGKTSHWLFFDWYNSIASIPFRNFGCQFRILIGEQDGSNGTKKNQIFAVLLGTVVALPALLIIFPLLSRADAGFEQMLGNFLQYISEHLLVTIFRMLLAIPAAAYLYGLVFGSISGRNTDHTNKSAIRETGESMRIIPDVTVGTAMAVICLVYVAFIALQGKYMFSAFAGTLPAEFTYAEYARRGFFELCQIGVLNMVILGSMGILSKTKRKENKLFRIMSVCLSVLTLLILATAMSKMGMYIIAYGLTVKRILTMVFMIWMAITFTGVIIQQRKDRPLVRISVMAGAVLFALLCICPVEKWILLYNTTLFIR